MFWEISLFWYIHSQKVMQIGCSLSLSKIKLLNAISLQTKDMLRSVCKQWYIDFESLKCSKLLITKLNDQTLHHKWFKPK